MGGVWKSIHEAAREAVAECDPKAGPCEKRDAGFAGPFVQGFHRPKVMKLAGDVHVGRPRAEARLDNLQARLRKRPRGVENQAYGGKGGIERPRIVEREWRGDQTRLLRHSLQLLTVSTREHRPVP